MTHWLARVFRRTVRETPDTPSILAARNAERQMDAADSWINDTISSLELRDRQREREEDLRRINRTGNFPEGWLTPERRLTNE